MRHVLAWPERGMDRATAWTLVGCVTSVALLARLAAVDYFESSGLFHPHGYCYLWLPSLVSTHVISDLLIGLSYVAISGTLAFLVWKARRDLPFSWMFIAFGSFIVACGATHFMEIWTLWTPVFWLSAGVKIVTALASVVTAVALPPLVPKVLALVADARLSEQRRLELEEARADLEQRVRQRTSDLERALESTAQAEERFRLVVEAAPNAMLMVDRERRIVLINRKGEELFGYPRTELIDQPVEVLIPEPLRAVHPGHVQGFLRAPMARPMGVGRELFGRRKDGTDVPIEIGLNPLELPQGQFTLASIIDVTERKRVEDDLRRSNADLEQFAYIASHDLQEPLRMVASYTDLLGQRYRGQLDEKADKYIHYATDGARRMQRLVTDLLAYSRVGSQGERLRAVMSDSVVKAVVESLGESIREAGASVEIGSSLPTVIADEGQLFQVLQNLIGNAIKFRSLEPPRVVVSAVPRDNRWVFSVQDNGIGIDKRYADRIFQMFQRLHEQGTHEGSGIGLAIAKRIVERHGGRIWLESTVGGGTTFFFTLSAAKGKTAP